MSRVLPGQDTANYPGRQESAFRFSIQYLGARLSIPFLLAILLLDMLEVVANNDRRILWVASGYTLWIVLPCCAWLSAAMTCSPAGKIIATVKGYTMILG